MNREIFVKTLSSLLLLGLAYLVLQALWIRYQVDPLTRDGKVMADIVQVTPDVSGWLVKICVSDNEAVKKGQVLLMIDPSRYQLALTQAEANLNSQQISLAQAKREDRRNHALSSLVDTETIEEGTERVGLLQAAVVQAQAAVDLAKLNLDRTTLRAPVAGIVSNMTLQPGDYLTTGKSIMALVDTSTLRIEGYFEETKMPAIHVGDKADVTLMGVANVIHGHVSSIAAGVKDRERSPDENMLDNINPSFTWVRLAQRIPVRIAIDQLPQGMRLIAGQTASVQILSTPHEVKVRRGWPW